MGEQKPGFFYSQPVPYDLVGRVGSARRAAHGLRRAQIAWHSGDVRYVVWVDAWQQQCCGEPFSVGSRVGWTLRDLPRGRFFEDVAGAEIARRITHAEEHHGAVPEDTPVVQGTVREILAIHASLVRERDWTPGESRAVAAADGWDEVDGLSFNGYVVDLDVDRP